MKEEHSHKYLIFICYHNFFCLLTKSLLNKPISLLCAFGVRAIDKIVSSTVSIPTQGVVAIPRVGSIDVSSRQSDGLQINTSREHFIFPKLTTLRANVSKSSLREHTLELDLQMVKGQAAPLVMADEVK